MGKEKDFSTIYDPIPIESQKRLVEIMNDSPSRETLAGTEWEIRALKPGTMWKICEVACDIVLNENMSMGDVLKELSLNLPACAKVIAYAILNDKKRIDEEFDAVFNLLMWETSQQDWARVLVEIIALCDVESFFVITESIAMLRQMTLTRKMTRKEHLQLSLGQSGAQ